VLDIYLHEPYPISWLYSHDSGTALEVAGRWRYTAANLDRPPTPLAVFRAPQTQGARAMRFPLGIGEHTTLTNPETGEPVTVRVTAGDDGRLTIIVEAVPGSAVKVTAPPNADVVYQYKVPDSHRLQ
jgi:hypothetical protein